MVFSVVFFSVVVSLVVVSVVVSVAAAVVEVVVGASVTPATGASFSILGETELVRSATSRQNAKTVDTPTLIRFIFFLLLSLKSCFNRLTP